MTATYHLRYLEAGASALKDYLLSKELFWPVDAAAPITTPPEAAPLLVKGSSIAKRSMSIIN